MNILYQVLAASAFGLLGGSLALPDSILVFYRKRAGSECRKILYLRISFLNIVVVFEQFS
jgi:hypothetical protein